MIHLLVAGTAVIWLVFVAAAASKVLGRSAFRDFRDSVVETGLVPTRLATPVAGVIVATEIGTVTLVPIPYTTTVGLAMGSALMAVFSYGTWLVARRGIRATCRCFGPASSRLGRVHLVRNLIILAVGVTCLLAGMVGPSPTVAALSVAVLPAATTGVVGAAALIRFEDVAALIRPVGGRAGQSQTSF